MTSGLKRGLGAAVCALGATLATITPAHAATASASYNCGTLGGSVRVTFTRTAPTLTVKMPVSFTLPTPIGVGAITAVLGGPSPYPIAVTNPNLIPAGPVTMLTLTKPSPVPLPGPPTSIGIPLPGGAITCTLLASPAPSGWPI